MTSPLIMIVDDDEDIREMVAMILEWNGFRVACACDGLDALEQLRRVCPDLLLLDLMMPRLSGVELVRRLRQEGLCDGVPVLVLSGDGASRGIAATIGASALLVKPISLEDLVAAVRRVLDAHASRRPASE